MNTGLTKQAIYSQLGQLLESAPNLRTVTDRILPSDVHQWFSRVQAMMLAGGFSKEATNVKLAHQHAQSPTLRDYGLEQARVAIYDCLAILELQVPGASQGAFVPVGGSFDTFVAVQKIFTSAGQTIMVVDPYMDEATVTDFAVLAPEGVGLLLLTDAASKKASLLPAVSRWQVQHVTRPLEAKMTGPRLLHDRLIIVDEKDAWTLTQSLKDFAVRSPGSIVKADPAVAALKVDAYRDLWSDAAPLA